MKPLTAGDPGQIGPYRLIGVLGAGGMGQVYLGMSPGGRAVAVKVVFNHLARDPMFIARFRREVEAAKSVSGVYTAPVIASGLDDRPQWFASGYVEGPSLAEAVIERNAPLPEIAVWRLAAGLVEALQDVHAANLVHRDLKPANVLLALDGPKVIDFGITKALEGMSTTASRQMPIGTPAFMSPEQANCDAVGPASDVFSLGSVIAFAATGRILFRAGHPAAELLRVVDEEPDLTGMAQPLRELVRSCLAKDPADRPSLSRLLDAIIAGSADYPSMTPSSFWPRSLADFIRSRSDITNPRDVGFAQPDEPQQKPPAQPVTEHPARRPRKSRSRKLHASVSAAVIIALITTLAWRLRPGDQPSAAATLASYTRPVQHFKDGLLISTQWMLGGSSGSLLTAKITATDATGAALAVQFEMPFPVALLKDLGAARFSPSPPMVIDHGRGLVWPLRIPAHGSAVMYIRLDVGSALVSEARLKGLVSRLTSVQPGPADIPAPQVTLQSLMIIPKRPRVQLGGSERLKLVGLLSNGKRASPAYLSKIKWRTANLNVARVNAVGRITAVAVGETRVTATVGKVKAYVLVVVTVRPKTGQDPSGGGQQAPSSAPTQGHSQPHSSSSSPPVSTPTSHPAPSPTTSPTQLP